jgi:hypothetical protein
MNYCYCCGASRDCCELRLRRTVRVCHVARIDHGMSQCAPAISCASLRNARRGCASAKGNALIRSASAASERLRDAMLRIGWTTLAQQYPSVVPAHDCARPPIYRSLRLFRLSRSIVCDWSQSMAYTAPTGRRRARSAAPSPPRCRRGTRSSLPPHGCAHRYPPIAASGPAGCRPPPVVVVRIQSMQGELNSSATARFGTRGAVSSRR